MLGDPRGNKPMRYPPTPQPPTSHPLPSPLPFPPPPFYRPFRRMAAADRARAGRRGREAVRSLVTEGGPTLYLGGPCRVYGEASCPLRKCCVNAPCACLRTQVGKTPTG